MKSVQQYLVILFAVMSLQEIPPMISSAETPNARSCPTAELENESLRQIRNYVRSFMANYQSTVEHCGPGMWHRIAYLNMSDPSQQCPSNWRYLYDNPSGVRACGRFGIGCPGVFYPVTHQYSRVCG